MNPGLYTARPSATPPPAPPLTGLKVWLKSDVGFVLTDGKLSQWLDQSLNGNDVVQDDAAARPVRDVVGFSGLPTFVFDGAAGLVGPTNPITSGSDRQLIVVARPTVPVGNPGGGTLMSFRTGRPLGLAAFSTFGSLHFGVYSDTENVNVTAPGIETLPAFTSPGNPAEFEWSAQVGSVPVVAINGVSLSTDITFGDGKFRATTGADGFTVGSNAVIGDWAFLPNFHGSISEILLYDHVLSGADLIAARAYILARYGGF